MEKNGSRWFAGFLIMGFLFGFVFSSPVMAQKDEEGRSHNPNLVSGHVTSVQRHQVFVDKKAYHFSVDVRFYDEEGGVVQHGRRKLKRDRRVDLSLKNNAIVRVTIYGLLPM